MPVLKRLSQLLLANNPVRTVSVNLATSLPNLRTLVLTNAAIPKDALAHTAVTLGRCRKLEHLSLKGCPVQHAQHYKDWIIFNCKTLRSLDFERVHLKVRGGTLREMTRRERGYSHAHPPPPPWQDREHANSLFLTATGEPTALHTSFLEAAASGSAAAAPSLVSSGTGTKTFEPGVEAAERDAGKAGRLLTKEEKDRVRKAIEGAESVEEVRSLSLFTDCSWGYPLQRLLACKERKSLGGTVLTALESRSTDPTPATNARTRFRVSRPRSLFPRHHEILSTPQCLRSCNGLMGKMEVVWADNVPSRSPTEKDLRDLERQKTRTNGSA